MVNSFFFHTFIYILTPCLFAYEFQQISVECSSPLSPEVEQINRINKGVGLNAEDLGLYSSYNPSICCVWKDYDPALH